MHMDKVTTLDVPLQTQFLWLTLSPAGKAFAVALLPPAAPHPTVQASRNLFLCGQANAEKEGFLSDHPQLQGKSLRFIALSGDKLLFEVEPVAERKPRGRPRKVAQ